MTRSVASAIVIVLFASLLHGLAPPVAAQETFHAVSGKVLSDTGAPIAGATVSGWSYAADGTSTADKTLSGEDGAFTLKLAAGKAEINAYYEKWRASDATRLDLSGDVSGIELTLRTPPPKDAIVVGTVTGPDGKPIEGATVTLQQGCCYAYAEDAVEPAPPAGEGGGSTAVASPTMTRPAIYPDHDYQQVTTGADGAFRFETYAGPRQVVAWAKGYAQSTVDVQAESGRSVTADVKLEKVPAASAVLKGRVVDAKTGAPVANAGVQLNNLAWGRYDYTETNADGTYSFKTIPGWATISIHGVYGTVVALDGVASDAAVCAPESCGRPAGPQYYAWTKSLRLKDGETTLDIRLEPKPSPDVVLIGYVVDPDTEKAVPNAHVNVWNQDTGDWGSATTDATGSYKILVRAGHYTANAWAERHLGGAATFVIEAGERTKRVDIEMPAGETRYAPCYDDECARPMGVYAEGEKSAVGDMRASGAPQPTPAAPHSATTASALSSFESGAPDDGSTRAATYTGSGGGLPPYDPARKDESATLVAAEDHNRVPAPAAAFVLVALGAVAVLLARRRG